MNKFNLLFSKEENYELWDKYELEFNQTLIDLNINDLITYLEILNSDFPKIYLLKPCINKDDSNFRLDIMEEILGNNDLLKDLLNLSSELKTLSQRIYDFRKESIEIQKQYRYLRIVCDFYNCIGNLYTKLNNVKSDGLMKLFNYCKNILTSDFNVYLKEFSNNILNEIEDMISNNILVLDPENKLFSFEKCNPEVNETELLKSSIYDKFGITINNIFSIVDPAPLSNMEEKILSELNKNYPNAFIKLNEFYNKGIDLLEYIESFSRIYKQITFYTTYIEFLKLASNNGISYCKPEFNDLKFEAVDCANPSLVINKIENKLLNEVTTNNINLPVGKMFFLSGPNQGGKTIYLKSVGLTAYLARCGCYVLCKSCKVIFYDLVGTHFMMEEVLGKGRLIEEVERMEKFIPKITSRSLLLLNESFTSTRRSDGVKIALKYLHKLNELECSVGFVSHYYEIPEVFNHKDIIYTLSCGKDEEGIRNYKIIESLGDKQAYARDIAFKCQMTYTQIRKFIEDFKNEKY